MTTDTPLVSEFTKRVYNKYKARYSMDRDGYVGNFRTFWEDWCTYFELLSPGDNRHTNFTGRGVVGYRMNLMQSVSREFCNGKLEKLWKVASRKHHPDKIERCTDDTADDIAKKLEQSTATIQLVNKAKDFFMEFFDFYSIPPINVSYNCLYNIYKQHQGECENPMFNSYSNASWSLLIAHYEKGSECSAKDDQLETINNKLRDAKAHEASLQQQMEDQKAETMEVQQRIQTMSEELAKMTGDYTTTTDELTRVTALLTDRTKQVEHKNKELVVVHQKFERINALIIERTQQIEKLKVAVQEKEEQAVATHTQFTRANNRVTELDGVIVTLRDQCEQRNQQIEVMTNQYNALQQDIDQKDARIETLNTGLKRKTTENANLKRKNTKLMKLDGQNMMGQSGNRFADNNVQQWREQMEQPVETTTRRQTNAATSAIAKRLRQNKAFYQKYRYGSWYNVTKFYKDIGISSPTRSRWCEENTLLKRVRDIDVHEWDGGSNTLHMCTYMAKLADFALILCNLAPKYKKTSSVLMNQLQLTTKDMETSQSFAAAFRRVYGD